jgi:hypothetical protein
MLVSPNGVSGRLALLGAIAHNNGNKLHRRVWVMQRLIGCAVLVLTGCTTNVEPTSAYTLSQADISAVVTGISSAHKDFDSLNFADLRAARSEDAHTYVCGWLSYKKNGYFMGEQRFFGTLFASRFVLERFGNGIEAAEVLEECHQHGVAT